MKHSPAPWNKTQNLIVDSNKDVVATVSRERDGYVQANIHLIKAAPAMLEALRDLVQAADIGMGKTAIRLRIELARDTIKLAEGES